MVVRQLSDSVALHTAARRFAEEQEISWRKKYEAMAFGAVKFDGGQQRKATLRRVEILGAILLAVERINPSDLDDVAETRRQLIDAGQTAEDEYYVHPPRNPVEESEVLEAREDFCNYIRNLSRADLKRVEPLPFRRVLGRQEAKDLWVRVRAGWGVALDKDYWYPLTPCQRDDVIAFDTDHIYNFIDTSTLHQMLTSRGVERVWEFRENGPEFELDLPLFNPYFASEYYWTSSAMDWIIYMSHENSTTVGGWLADEVKDRWPSWQQHVWGRSWVR